MAHIHYEEVQRFSQLRWVWMVSTVILLTPLVVFLMNEPSPSDDEGVILTLLTTLFAFLPVGLILLFGRLEIKVNNVGFHYRFPPSKFKWKIIDISNISSIESREKKGLVDHVACGYRKSILRNIIFMNIIGQKFVIVRLTNGLKIKIGSQNAESLVRTLKALRNPKKEI